ncbi:unnamed protein product [Mesocestoides corti]|uniref:Uncharacterized protein n=1 Tax=Mesocestoides corti TaxID=53468 RepID=A0A0R3UGC0_MESCO|nr:unnamed protein product [Mesocestoides corti]
MGMTVSDFVAVVTGDPSAREKSDLRKIVWPKHTVQELQDPTHMVYLHDQSEKGWSIRFKALGCFDNEIPATSLPEDKSTLGISPSDSRRRDDLSNNARVREKHQVNTITLAQQKELIKTLQLSESDESDDGVKKSDVSVTSPEKLSKPVSLKGDTKHQNRSPDIADTDRPLPPIVSPLLSKAKLTPACDVPKQRVCDRQTDSPSKTKSRSGTNDRGTHSKALNKRGVYSPLVVRVPEANCSFGHSQNSTEEVNTLTSLPAQCLSNQENVPSALIDTHEKTEQFVRRVLADAEAFCKPLQYLPDNFLIGANELSTEGGELEFPLRSDEKFKSGQQYFTLKRVSPLPATVSDIGRSGLSSTNVASPPLPKKEKKSSKKLNSPSSSSSHKNRKLTQQHKNPRNQKLKKNGKVSRRCPSAPFIVPSLPSHDLRPRIPAIALSSSIHHISSTTDKLASIRFILHSLRIPNSAPSKRTPRELNAVLLAPCHLKQTVSRVETENGSPLVQSTDYYLSRVLKHNDEVMERIIRRYENTTEEQQLTQASRLDTEAAACWSQLVQFVASTSSSSASTPNSLIKPFVCSCSSETQRLLHFLFNQTDFTSYPERILASTRHILVAALMSTSLADAKRRYDQALESLAKTALRMRRAESKLLRRAWVAIRCSKATGGRDLPISRIAELGEDAKRWSDLWYSALARVKAVVSDKFYQLLSEQEQDLRKKVMKDESLLRLNLLSNDEDLVLDATPFSSDNREPPLNSHRDYPTSTLSSSTERNGVADDCREHFKSDYADRAMSDEGGGDDKSNPTMCTVPRSTLERLLKVFHMTSFAHESLQSRRESELVLPTDRFAVFGSEEDKQTQRQLPVFVAPAPTSDMNPLIVFIDSVLQRHRRIVSRLSACPDAHQQQPSSVLSPKKPQPAAPPQKPTSQGKPKRSKSPKPPPPPAFEALPVRPPDLVIHKGKKHQSRRLSSQTPSDEAGDEKKTKRRGPSPPSSQPSAPIKKHRTDHEGSRNRSSRCVSVAPSRRKTDRNDGEDTDDSQKRIRLERKVHRGRSVVASSKRSPRRDSSASKTNGVEVETYSPRKNASISGYSYSPSRPNFSNERQESAGAGDTYEPTYIPSVPAPPRRTFPHEPPPKTSLQPSFYTKWLDGGSSNRR